MNSKSIQHTSSPPKRRHRVGLSIVAAATLVNAAILVDLTGCGGSGSNLSPSTPGALTDNTIGLYGTPGPTLGPTANPATGLAAVKLTTLVADTAIAGAQRDPHLVNGWGIAFSSFGTIWVSANGTGTTTVYDGTGKTVLPAITVPAPPGQSSPSAPTGQIFNSSANFRGDSFILCTEDGTVSGWQGGSAAVLRINAAASHAVYKGLAAGNDGGKTLLYVANFHGGTVDVFDSNYNPVHLAAAFKDGSLPLGYAPYNIVNYGKDLLVAYAKQDAEKHDDVKGVGNGFLDVFDPTGRLLQHLVAHSVLNSPWGMVLAPTDFGALSHRLLVGNFGDGHINVFNASTGQLLGQLKDSATKLPLTIDGLWGLSFGNGTAAGKTNQLFFSSGPGDEKHGRFGRLDLVP